MDPRQPSQHQYSRSTTSAYGRNPFPPSTNQAQFPPASHPPAAAPSYTERQRRPSDPPYYNGQRDYRQDGPIAGSNHSRHQSASSIGHGTPVNRAMPPPSSPQQGQQATHHSYGPPPPRAPALSVGPPSAFPSNRELPSLPSLGRPASTGGGGMSISSILGPSSREPPQSQYAPPATTSAPTSIFGPSQSSPRANSSVVDYAPFRRPQTPEHQRNYETRDHRANSAGSPPGVGHYTPEARRFGTPQQPYTQRAQIVEERREPVRVPNPNVPPPRPNSQPNSYNPGRIESSRQSQHENMFGRRVEGASRAPEPHRLEQPYGRPNFEERHIPYGYAERERDRERERQLQEAAIQRERDREREAAMREREIAIIREREREQRERAAEAENNLQREYAQQMAQRNAQNPYSRPPETREQPAWMRGATYEPSRAPYDLPSTERPPPQSNGYGYPTTSAQTYGGQTAYSRPEPSYIQGPPPSSLPQHNADPTALYEASLLERQRIAQLQQQHSAYSSTQGGPYQHESPIRRSTEESQPMQPQRSTSGFLGIREINRGGRVSPLPQPVQGPQAQMNGPGGEPSIKNEFGRMFSGIGSGVGSGPSPVSGGPGSLPFSTRRDDFDGLPDTPTENGYKITRTASRGGRRRKLKEEDSRGDDESSTGRRTPSGRGKRAKSHHHHHVHQPHRHHHHPDPTENTSSPSNHNLTPFRSVRIPGNSKLPSPPDEPIGAPNLHHHLVPRTHHHHHVTPKAVPPVNTIVPLPKITVKSQAVLDSVADLPRHHLGHGYYQVKLTTSGSTAKRNFTSGGGFASTPQALPRFEGSENCTYTIKIPRVHLSDISREEITARRAVWGTDIYTDDSDIIATCIHQGWFRGAWSDDIDISLLDLEIDPPEGVQKPLPEDTLVDPPATGPVPVPSNRDCHVTILILPTLEMYSSMTRFGLRSREWGGKRDGYKGVHDGLSFKIMDVKFVDGVDGVEGRSGRERNKLFLDLASDKELAEEQAWEERIMNAKGKATQPDGIEESFERGPARQGFQGLGVNSWWQAQKDGGSKKGKEKEKAKTLSKPVTAPASVPTDPASIIQLVTERMIVNANTVSQASVSGPITGAESHQVKHERISDDGSLPVTDPPATSLIILSETTADLEMSG